MRITRQDTAGLFVDIQERLFPHMQDREMLEKNLICLAEGFKILEIPVIITEQYTKGLGFTVPSLKESLAGYDPIEKISFSCCDEPGFIRLLAATGKKFIVLCGIETHVCILQTALDLIRGGYVPVVIEDCVSSRKARDKAVAIERMRQEGAIISSLESVLFELTRTSGTDTFKAISRLVK